MTLAYTPRITTVDTAWTDQLSAACFMLTERPLAAKAVSISRGFPHGTEDERDAVVLLARRLAEEHGLIADIEVEGFFLRIRLSRHLQAEAAEPDNETPLIERVRSLLKRH